MAGCTNSCMFLRQSQDKQNGTTCHQETSTAYFQCLLHKYVSIFSVWYIARFEVSKRTIFRDLDTLNESGVPIVTYSGIGDGVAVIEEYKLKSNILTKNDIENVFTALIMS